MTTIPDDLIGEKPALFSSNISAVEIFGNYNYAQIIWRLKGLNISL